MTWKVDPIESFNFANIVDEYCEQAAKGIQSDIDKEIIEALCREMYDEFVKYLKDHYEIYVPLSFWESTKSSCQNLEELMMYHEKIYNEYIQVKAVEKL